jgi:hypothetical protein
MRRNWQTLRKQCNVQVLMQKHDLENSTSLHFNVLLQSRFDTILFMARSMTAGSSDL